MTTPNRRIEAVVFDMDGVLIDSEVVWRQVRVEYAAEIGQVWSNSDQMDLLGRSTPDWSQRMRSRLQLNHLTAEALAQEIIGRVLVAFGRGVPQRPGAAQALEALSAHYPLALASGSPRELMECAMQQTGFSRYFQSLLCGDDVQHGKPNPEIYLRTLQHLGVNARHAVGIEDAPNGIQALRAAGMKVVAAPCPEFPLDADVLALADVHITSMEQLTPQLLESIAC